jgi:hypothetical protein
MRLGLSHRVSVLVLYSLALAFAILGGGVLMGRRQLFVWACGLGVGLAVGLEVLSRSARQRRVRADSLGPALGGEIQEKSCPAGGRVVSAPRPVRSRQPEDAVLAEMPPAAGGRP